MGRFLVTFTTGQTGYLDAADEVAANDYLRLCCGYKDFTLVEVRGQVETTLGNLEG